MVGGMKTEDGKKDDRTQEVSLPSRSSDSDSSCETTPGAIPGGTNGPFRRSTMGGWTDKEEDRSPCSSVQTNLSCSTEFSNLFYGDDSRHANVSDDLLGTPAIQSKAQPSVFNELVHMFHIKSPQIKDLKSKGTMLLQLTHEGSSLSGERISKLENYIQQTQSPAQYCTPPNISSNHTYSPRDPISYLRAEAKSFKNTPSIFRRCRHVDLSRTVIVNAVQFSQSSHDCWKPDISDATKSVERKLEEELDMEFRS